VWNTHEEPAAGGSFFLSALSTRRHSKAVHRNDAKAAPDREDGLALQVVYLDEVVLVLVRRLIPARLAALQPKEPVHLLHLATGNWKRTTIGRRIR
jgi:hypothetical protein